MGKSIDELISSMPAERRELIETSALQIANDMIAQADSLEVLRKACGLTQAEVARILGVQQNAVSQLENRTDIYISTLQKFIKALGMDLEILLVSKDGRRIPLPNFHPWKEVSAKVAPATKQKSKAGTGVKSAPVAKLSKHKAAA
jgi:DNA-binding XRE family transcriptional regulator